MTKNYNVQPWTPREVARLTWAYTLGGIPAAVEAVPTHKETSIRSKIEELRRAGHNLVPGRQRRAEPVSLGRVPSVFHLASHLGCVP